MLANRTTRPRVTCSVSASVSGRAGPARVQTETHSTVTRSFPPHVNVTRYKPPPPPPPEPQHRHGRPPTPAPRAVVTPQLPVFVLCSCPRPPPLPSSVSTSAPRRRVASEQNRGGAHHAGVWPGTGQRIPPLQFPPPTPHHHTRRPRRNAARGRGGAERRGRRTPRLAGRRHKPGGAPSASSLARAPAFPPAQLVARFPRAPRP